MTDYTELVKALRDEDNCNVFDYIDDAAAAIEALQSQLPKRGEIVRCGECKHRKDSIQCQLYSEGIKTADDWFCADGEREVHE